MLQAEVPGTERRDRPSMPIAPKVWSPPETRCDSSLNATGDRIVVWRLNWRLHLDPRHSTSRNTSTWPSNSTTHISRTCQPALLGRLLWYLGLSRTRS